MIATATLIALVAGCAPQIATDTALALVAVESAGNPFAIGVVGGALVRQPGSLEQALATTAALDAAGWDYSAGLGQINRRNFARLGLTAQTAFEPCTNLGAMQVVLGGCFERARQRAGAERLEPATVQATEQAALRNALSCYYSGNFTTGHRHGYVGRVLGASRRAAPARPRPLLRSKPVPSIRAVSHTPPTPSTGALE